jgi:hypothetical protein
MAGATAQVSNLQHVQGMQLLFSDWMGQLLAQWTCHIVSKV